VTCWSRSQAEAALERRAALPADLGLEPKAAKTRIVHLEAGGGGFDFLGFHHRLVRSRGVNGKKQVTFLARWPADKVMQHARDRTRELTLRSPAAAEPEADRGGPEPVPGRLGRLLPVRQLRRPLREDQELFADAHGAVHQQAQTTVVAGKTVAIHFLRRRSTSCCYISLIMLRTELRAITPLVRRNQTMRNYVMRGKPAVRSVLAYLLSGWFEAAPQ
jgi:hypothetical protein